MSSSSMVNSVVFSPFSRVSVAPWMPFQPCWASETGVMVSLEMPKGAASSSSSSESVLHSNMGSQMLPSHSRQVSRLVR